MTSLKSLLSPKKHQHNNAILFLKYTRHSQLTTILFWTLFVCGYTTVNAQETTMEVRGRVIDGKTKKPLSGASVYLDNTTKATVSSADGQFVLSNISKGNYTLIVSFVGYNSISTLLNAGSANNYTVELLEDERMLNEVSIKINPNWEEYFLLFKMFFIAKNEQQCKITNPKVLYFNYDNSNYTLTAEATKPLIIENYALGYRVYYELTSFVHYAGRTSYSGNTHFEELKPSNKKELKKWRTNREKAYRGSSTHFMHSLVNRRLKEEGFVVKKLLKTDTASSNSNIAKRWEGEEYKSPDTIVSMRWNGLNYVPNDTTILTDKDHRSSLNARYNVLYPGNVSYEGNKQILASFWQSKLITYFAVN